MNGTYQDLWGQGPTYASQVERLKTIPGIEEMTASTILAEMGPDASAFRDDKHVASWAGLCPGNHESAG